MEAAPPHWQGPQCVTAVADGVLCTQEREIQHCELLGETAAFMDLSSLDQADEGGRPGSIPKRAAAGGATVPPTIAGQ